MSEWSVNLKAASEFNTKNVDAHLSNDFAIMQRIKNEDEQALMELVERYGDTLARLIGRLTGWHVDGDDILQEVLITAWQKAGAFNGQGPLEGWLKKIAINRCRNHYRSLNAVQRKIERVATMLIGRNNETSQTNIYQSEIETQLNRALRKLPQNDRMALVLFYQEEIPGQEVAEILKLKHETFHVRLHRARLKLKKILDELNYDDR